MLAGEVKGLFCFGQNPAVGGANARLVRAGLDKLEWMVVADLFEHETASFWKRPGADPARIPPRSSCSPASGVEKRAASSTAALGAVALPAEAHRRLPPDLDIVDGWPGHQARLREGRGVPGADTAPGLGLWTRGRSASRRAGAERTLLVDDAGRRASPRANRCRASRSSGTTAARCRATGSTAAATRRRATWPRDAVPMRRMASGSIPSGRGRGR